MQIMLVAPGTDVDRMWIDADQAGSGFVYDKPSADLPMRVEDTLLPARPQIGVARVVRYRVPGWRVVLTFAVADDAWVGRTPGAYIRPGYLLPGYIGGDTVEAVPVCTWCYGHTAPWRPPEQPLAGRHPAFLTRHTEQECRAEKGERRRALTRITGI